MCVVSAVHDQYKPWMPGPSWPQQPWTVPYPSKPAPTPSVDKTIIITQPRDLTEEIEALRELIDSFHKAIEAAEVFDRLTGQPDCVDPEKGELSERVAELERKLDEISKAAGNDATSVS
jgi:hypothetical protein